MKPFIIHLLTLLVICFVLCTCRHEPTPPVCQYDSTISEMKRWYYFKTGSRWIYQEETTGVLDTILVFDDSNFESPSGAASFSWNVSSSYDGFWYFYDFSTAHSIHCLSTEQCTCHKLNRAKGKPGNYVGDDNLFLFPIILNNYNNLVGYPPNSQGIAGLSIVTDVDLEFVLGNDTIKNVVRWEVSTDDSNDGWPSVYYLAKDIGFVRIVHENPNLNWKLIEYTLTP